MHVSAHICDHGDEEYPVIHFSDEEKACLPDADEVLPILVPVARDCYRLLDPLKPRFDDDSGKVHFIQSVDCAIQVMQRQEFAGPVNLEDLAAHIDIPYIEYTLPRLVDAFKRCRLIWSQREHHDLAMGMVYMAHIGAKMYPQGMICRVIHSYGDIFADVPPRLT